jgi:hypothetical protein
VKPLSAFVATSAKGGPAKAGNAAGRCFQQTHTGFLRAPVTILL